MSILFSMRGVRLLTCLLASVTLLACAIAPEGEVQPVKSLNDKYSYRLLTLDNELQVLLISAPESPKAAAAMAVMVGSGENPPGRAGLAHFLEHMLFLGTDKYPDPAEYERYITEHGGRRNAYTSFDHTNYFFDIDTEFLPQALDRFAQFFVAPRFDAEYVDREKQAVEAEYQMGLKSDGRRNLDVLQEVMNPAHPYSQFAVGNLETLADREDSTVRSELLRFYDKYYSANIMRLAVLGNESLDELEALVRPMFSQVRNKAVDREPVDVPIFPRDSLPMHVQAQPLATLKQLEVSFPVPDYRDDYRVKPVAYVGNLVGHEGEGSLLARLKAEGLASGLGAGPALGWRGGSLFGISISLTDKGVAQHERVLELLFAYLDMLRERGPENWLYDEQARLAQLSFRFREPGNPSSYVTALAAGMRHYAPRDVLRGPYMMEDYDAGMLEELLGYLRPDNAFVLLNDQSVETDTVSDHYQVPYARAPLDVATVKSDRDDPAAAELDLPSPNEFIAEDVSLVELPDPVPEHPRVALESERQRIWYMPDDEFRVPKGALYINFRSAEVDQTPEQAALTALYTSVLSDNVKAFSYPAQLAGMGFSFNQQPRGITLRLSGYNDKQLLLLDRLLEVVREPDFDKQRFEDLRRDMIRALGNTAAKRPSSQVMDDLRQALRHGEWPEEALIAALEEADLDTLLSHAENFRDGATAEVLVYGNYTQGVPERVARMLDSGVSGDAAAEQPEVKILRLAPGEELQYVVDVPHDDSLVAWYLQGAGDTWHDRAATALTAQIMKSDFFQQLRTEQQLGYVVSAFYWPRHGVPGLVMLVQSPRRDAAGVTAAIETFVEALPAALDRAAFGRHKAALLSEILRPDKNLQERAGFYWSSINRRQWDFDGREALAESLQQMNLEDWRAYFDQVFERRRHSMRVIAPGRWEELPDTPGCVVRSAAEIKRGHAVYRLP